MPFFLTAAILFYCYRAASAIVVCFSYFTAIAFLLPYRYISVFLFHFYLYGRTIPSKQCLAAGFCVCFYLVVVGAFLHLSKTFADCLRGFQVSDPLICAIFLGGTVNGIAACLRYLAKGHGHVLPACLCLDASRRLQDIGALRAAVSPFCLAIVSNHLIVSGLPWRS